MTRHLLRQAGVALPVMLFMLLTMAITSIYLVKSVNSSTINATNAAYESALVRAADVGLHTAFTWLNATAKANRADLNTSVVANAYNARFDPQLRPRDPAFWVNSKTVVNGADTVEYVIHRMCALPGRYDQVAPRNSCVMTTHADVVTEAVAIGESLALDAPTFVSSPQVHYLLTSRLSGPRGGNVVNQMVVLIGI